MEHCWMDIEGYEDYYRISDGGLIFSKIRNRRLSPYKTPKGYLHIDLRGRSFSVHRLVLKHFKPHRNMETLQVNHKDSNKKNNKLCNLEWVTNLENQRHSWDNGRRAVRGEAQGASKLSSRDVKKIKFLLKQEDCPWTHKEISKKFGVSRSTITSINRGKIWKHI